MKRSLSTLILLLVLVNCQGQNTNTKATPCTDIIAQTTKGKWINNYDLAGNVTRVQKQEAYKRLDIMHYILLKMYPEPTGVDVRMNRGAGINYFGATRKYRYTEDNRLTFDYVKLLPIIMYSYYANFSPHYCAHTNDGVVFMPGLHNENSDGIGISINEFAGVVGVPAIDDDWLINGLPVRMLTTRVNEQWKGYEVYGDVRLNSRAILIHREGKLPFIPVTRKQYLERCIAFLAKLHDNLIDLQKKIPVRSLEEQETEKKAKLAKFEKDFGKDPKRLKSAVDYYLSGYKTDQQIRDENIANAKWLKESELKKFADELEKTTREGQLDSPAYIRVMYISDLIFDNNPLTGSMLVTDNPDYIRKDLPAHVPQFIVLNWRWSEFPPHKTYQKIFLEDFPIEKIQAMIDK